MKVITKNKETGKLEYQSEELNTLYKLLAEKDKLIRQWEHWAITSGRVN